MKKLPLILGLVNTLAVIVVLGIFVYTKMIYKRPVITEKKERAIIAANSEKMIQSQSNRGFVALEPIVSNLDPYTGADGKERVHYVSMSVSVEIRSDQEISRFEEIKPMIMDQIIQQIGKKKYEDLNQVQGRYLFRSMIIDVANHYLKEPVVTEVYFTDFLLQ